MPGNLALASLIPARRRFRKQAHHEEKANQTHQYEDYPHGRVPSIFLPGTYQMHEGGQFQADFNVLLNV